MKKLIVALSFYIGILFLLSRLSESMAITLFIYAGFISAFCLFVLATIVRKSNAVRAISLVLAFLALIGQGGCFIVLGGIGTATGGNNIGAEKMMTPVKWAFLVAAIWLFVIFFIFPLKEHNENSSQDIGQIKKDKKTESDENKE